MCGQHETERTTGQMYSCIFCLAFFFYFFFDYYYCHCWVFFFLLIALHCIPMAGSFIVRFPIVMCQQKPFKNIIYFPIPYFSVRVELRLSILDRRKLLLSSFLKSTKAEKQPCEHKEWWVYSETRNKYLSRSKVRSIDTIQSSVVFKCPRFRWFSLQIVNSRCPDKAQLIGSNHVDGVVQ